VPAANGRARVNGRAGRDARCLESRRYVGAGHDQDHVEAPRATRAFLVGHLLSKTPALECREQQGGR
jgi:hypothetical protein